MKYLFSFKSGSARVNKSEKGHQRKWEDGGKYPSITTCCFNQQVLLLENEILISRICFNKILYCILNFGFDYSYQCLTNTILYHIIALVLRAQK